MGDDDPVAESSGHSRFEVPDPRYDGYCRSCRETPFEAIADQIVSVLISRIRDDIPRRASTDIPHIPSADENDISLDHQLLEQSPVAIVAKRPRSTNITVNAYSPIDARDETAEDKRRGRAGTGVQIVAEMQSPKVSLSSGIGKKLEHFRHWYPGWRSPNLLIDRPISSGSRTTIPLHQASTVLPR